MANESKALIWTQYAGVRILLGAIGALPRRASVRLSIWLVKLVAPLVKGFTRTGMRNLEIAFPERSEAERRKILSGTFENLGRVLGEMTHAGRVSRTQIAEIINFDFDQESKDLYALNKSKKRGVLITTGHLGNWEMLVQGFAALYEPISFMARPIDNPKIEALLTSMRTRFGNTPINKKNSIMLAVKIVREGGILGILCDVNTQPKEGVFVPFFGVPACTSVGPAMIAIRADALIFPTFCVWDQNLQRYQFVHGSLIEPVKTGDMKQDIIDTTAAYTAEIEKIIRKYPEQWMWIHKRWKTRPPGEPKIY